MGNGQSTNNVCITTREEENYPFRTVNGRFIWTIENFKNLTLATGSFNTSERLKIDANGQTDEYEVVFYPKGYNKRTENYISVWLKRISTDERLIEFTCEIPKINSEGDELVKKTIKKKLSIETCLGWSAFCKRSHILENETEVLNNGSLVLICNLVVYDDKCISHAALEDEDPGMDARLFKLSENFKDLLKDGKHCDVSFEMGRKTVSAHKAVLAARSPAFREMFDWKLEEKNGKIQVEDISRKTFASMLLFIYSGEFVRQEFDETFKLYYASEKYDLLSLKQICSLILIESLTTENAVKVAILANKHSDRILQYASVDFIAKNFKDIQEKEEWLSLMKDSPQFANKIFEQLTKINGTTNLKVLN